MVAMEALGADGVQIGSLFASSKESSAHENFKKRITELNEGDTVLTLKELTPVRLIKNEFYQQVRQAEQQGATTEALKNLLGRGRAKRGIFEGDLNEGELEIGQIAASIKSVEPAALIIKRLWEEYLQTKHQLSRHEF
jgi:enoyl-[acyl-carrier protein] reductase II